MNNQEVINHLRLLATKKQKPEFLSSGVCYELHNTCNRHDLKQKLLKVVNTWPLFSGDPAFPVPHQLFTPVTAFAVANNLWGENQYGDNRRALCTWFADYLEKENGNAN